MKTISLIVPCYNEEAIIYKTFNELSSYVEIIKDYNFQFIFVNDKTLEILKMIKAKEDRVIIININKNSGEFTGIKIALMNCNSDYAIWLQADLQVPCEVISKSIEAIETNPGHEVIYSLGHPHGSHFFSQLFWSWLFFRFTKKLGKYQLDAFLVNKRIIYNIQKK